MVLRLPGSLCSRSPLPPSAHRSHAPHRTWTQEWTHEQEWEWVRQSPPPPSPGDCVGNTPGITDADPMKMFAISLHVLEKSGYLKSTREMEDAQPSLGADKVITGLFSGALPPVPRRARGQRRGRTRWGVRGASLRTPWLAFASLRMQLVY